MIRAVIYARVSSEEQAAEGKTSIETQLADCRAAAARLGWQIVGEYIDDKRYRVGRALVEPSGTRADRPHWKRMLGDLAAGRAEALLAWHSSRLYRAYRPMVDFLEVLEARRIQVQLVKDSFDPRFAVLQAWLGKEENSARVERTYFGHVGRAKKGLSPTRVSMFFKKIVESASGELLGYEFDETFRPAFDAMARLFLQRHSYREIAKRLGTNPLTRKPWGYATVHDIMINPYYRGLIEFGRRSHKGIPKFTVHGRHKPVWDEATCASIDTELARRNVVGGHAPRSTVTPFAGVLRCGYCGWSMSAVHSGERRTPDGRLYRFYHCHHNRLVRQGYEAGTPHIPNGIAETKLLKLIRAELEGAGPEDVETIIMLLASQAPAKRVDDSATRAQLAEAERQIAELEADLPHIKSATTKAAITGQIESLREDTNLYRGHLATQQGRGTVDLEAMRQALLELVENPDLLGQPDPELKLLVNRCFPVLHIAEGRIVPAPAI